MYRCYACGKQIADDNDQCPFCKFPVISTLHGDHVEEEEILKFAEEYRRTNPEYFHEVNKVIPEEPAKIKPESTIAGPEKAGTAEANGQISEKDDTSENGLKSDKTAVPLKKKSKKGGFWIFILVLFGVVGYFAVIEGGSWKTPEQTTAETSALPTVRTWRYSDSAKETAAASDSGKIRNQKFSGLNFKNTTGESEADIETSSEEASSGTDYSVGSIRTFGSYEQDNDPANGPEPLEWIVVEDEGDAVLLISAYGIDVKPYNDVQADIEWEDCSLRTWLNNDFLNIAFDQGGAEMLKREELYNNDKVFLLLMTGYIFNSDIIGGACKMTPYAISQSAAQNSDDRSAWWLSNADFLGTGYRVDLNGETEFCLMTDLTAVRPSIILKKF